MTKAFRERGELFITCLSHIYTNDLYGRPQLFFFSYSRIDTEPCSEVGMIHQDCIVAVDTNDELDSGNDLVSRLTAILSRYHETGSNHDVIVEPSDVIAFHLRNS